ncbi:MAG TPA: glycosyltransferase family A protein [Pyrinomonadaceae bacterium]|nr:glycosyltransferase family A protein [Pyrinomonadaceae bacterium]
MSEYPFFSVVIPTYNRAAFIGATLETVLSQTYPHYEIIVVDNCSTDNTDEVLEPYIRTGRIQFIRHQQNYERGRSRNTGMGVAKGDFVTLLDSDDFMYPTNLADAAEYARAHPELKCFHNLYEFVDANHRVLQRLPMPSLSNQLKAIASGNFMTCIGDFIHREIYQKYKFDTTEALTGGEDWDFWLRVLADYKVGRIEKINSGILQHGGRSVNNQNLESMKRGLEHLYEKLSTDSHLRAVYGPYLRSIRANSLLYLGILANTAALFGEARHYLLEALKVDFSLIGNPRFWRVARRALLKLQP